MQNHRGLLWFCCIKQLRRWIFRKNTWSSMVKLSVIIPVYNAADFLPRTFESILSQDIDKEQYEVIVVNDGSTDDSLEIIQNVERHFLNFKWVSQENGGVSAARNRALDMVSGEYVMFLDADDAFREKALSQVMELVDQGNADIFFVDNHFPAQPVQYEPDGFLSKVYFSVFVWKACINYRLIKENKIRFSEGYILEDGIFLLETILKAKEIAIRKADLVLHNHNPKSLMRDYSEERKNRNMIASFVFVINKYQELADKPGIALSPAAYNSIIERKEYFIFFMIWRMVRYKWPNREITENLKKVQFTSFTVFPGVHHRKISYKVLAWVIENRFLRNVFNAAYRRLK